LSSPLPEGQVVLGAAAFVGVALDPDGYFRIGNEELAVALDQWVEFLLEEGLVEVKVDAPASEYLALGIEVLRQR